MLNTELDKRTDLQKHLYARGFMITNANLKDISLFPFYNNWAHQKLGVYNFYTHYLQKLHSYENNDRVFFLIGHASCFRQWDTLKVFGDYAKQLLLFDVHIK